MTCKKKFPENIFQKIFAIKFLKKSFQFVEKKFFGKNLQKKITKKISTNIGRSKLQ